MGPGVSHDSFIGAVWGTFAFATVFIAVRLYSRIRGARNLYLDDILALAAYVLSLATAVLWQWVAADMQYVLTFAVVRLFNPPSPTNPPPSPEEYQGFITAQIRWLRVCLAVELFFYTGLTLVKLSFLFFFRRLGDRVDKLRYLWWPNVFFTLAIYFVCVGTVQYECLVGSVDKINGWCNTKPGIDFTTATLQANAVLDVVSDLFILAIPITLLWDVRMKWPKKLTFMALFSLSVVTMAIAIVRAVDITRTKWVTGQNDPTYLWLWSAIEPCIAIAVSCLSAFPQLFAQSSRSATKPAAFSPTDSYKRMMSRIRSKENSDLSDTLANISAMCESRSDIETASTSQDSQRQMLSPVPPARTTVVYNGPSEPEMLGPGGTIMQEREIHVTRHRPAEGRGCDDGIDPSVSLPRMI